MEKTEYSQAQKGMTNSAQQARNMDGALRIGGRGVRWGPVLLVDDMVNSGWSLAMAAWLMRSYGSGEVFPLVLARVGHTE